jgi:hypothetical protein
VLSCIYANDAIDRLLLFRPVPSRSRMMVLVLPCHSQDAVPSQHHQVHSSSAALGHQPMTQRLSSLNYGRCNRHGTRISSSLDATRGKTHTSTFGANTKQCETGSASCRQLCYPLSVTSLSLSYYTATSISFHQVLAAQILVSMPSSSLSSTRCYMQRRCNR